MSGLEKNSKKLFDSIHYLLEHFNSLQDSPATENPRNTMITKLHLEKLSDHINGDYALTDELIALMLKIGIKFPVPMNFDDIGEDDSFCHYTDYKETEFPFGLVEFINVKGTTRVSSEGVENWTELHQNQSAENMEFYIEEIAMREDD